MSDDQQSVEASLDAGIRVANYNQQLLNEASLEIDAQKIALTSEISRAEELLLSLGRSLPSSDGQNKNEGFPAEKKRLVIKDWTELLATAERNTPENAGFDSLLTDAEIEEVVRKHSNIGKELGWLATFDRFDVAISVAAGVLAGLVDVLLVGIPAHPGFGGSSGSKGGYLSNAVKEKVGSIFPPDRIKDLEKIYSVPFDPSTSRGLPEYVAGLGPRSHRFQSLGHDPLLGFIFGVRDILVGGFTAISKDGHLIIQQVTDPFMAGESLVVRILEAMKIQLGHLASDIATPAGLPAPLMPLLSFLQFGKIGEHEHTIADVARAMYGKGYDFRHFMSASIPVMVSEIIVRLGYFIRQLQNGKSLSEAAPTASSVKLRRQLLIAHGVATLINAGKVYVTQNPLTISWPQALAFLRYVAPELMYLVYGQEAARSRILEKKILQDYHALDADLERFIAATGDFVLVV
ncbi:MAG: hypothetical protein HYU74_05855 [Dechloromonas sp.]|nr:hypothetical protein [Dechloromonas sp.]